MTGPQRRFGVLFPSGNLREISPFDSSGRRVTEVHAREVAKSLDCPLYDVSFGDPVLVWRPAPGGAR